MQEVAPRDLGSLLAARLGGVGMCSKRQATDAFLKEHVFAGLKPLRPWFDDSSIWHFSASDFACVLERCSVVGIAVNGVEVFNARAELVEVLVPGTPTSNSWCLRLLRKYADRTNLLFCATYDVPEQLLRRAACQQS